MPFIKRNIPDNRVLAQYGGGYMPATLGETLGAVGDDPTLRPTELIGTQTDIVREEGAAGVRGITDAVRDLPTIPGLPSGRSIADVLEGGAEFLEREEEDKSPLLSPKAASDQYGDLGLSFDAPVRQRTAEIMAEQKRDEMIRNDTLARGPTGLGAKALQLGAAFASAAVDPINIASAFVPVVGEARLAGLIGRFGTIAGRSIAGAAEGTVGAALVEPIVAGLARQQQLDYEMSDALVNVAFGGVLGGGLHVATGLGADILRKGGRSITQPEIEALSPEGRVAALKTATAQIARGADVDIEPVVQIDGALRSPAARVRSETALSGVMARGLGDPVGAQRVPLDIEAMARDSSPQVFERLDSVNEKLAVAERRLVDLERLAVQPDDAATAAGSRLADIEQRIATETDGRKLRKLNRQRTQLIEELGGDDAAALKRRESVRKSRARTESEKVSREISALRGERARADAMARAEMEKIAPTSASRRGQPGPEQRRNLERTLADRRAPARRALDNPSRFEEKQALDRANAAEAEAPKDFGLDWIDREVEFYGGFVNDIGDDLTDIERAALDEAQELVDFTDRYEQGIQAGALCLGRNL